MPNGPLAEAMEAHDAAREALIKQREIKLERDYLFELIRSATTVVAEAAPNSAVENAASDFLVHQFKQNMPGKSNPTEPVTPK